MAREKRRERIRETLDLATLVAAGANGATEYWSEKIQQLIDEMT